VRAALVDRGHRETDAGLTARCPAHTDQTPSVSVRRGDKVPVVVHRQAGCDVADVPAAEERGRRAGE